MSIVGTKLRQRPRCVARSSHLQLWLAVLWMGFCVHAAPARAAGIDPSVQAKLAAATFEVVMKKPVEDAMEYERPLPVERLPYAERTDPYRSVGTAFAIGPNRFVSAAHVIDFGRVSQFGPPALRDSNGVVHEIDSVYAYSNERDFVAFSVKTPPAISALTPNLTPTLNARVFAVGNARGEGVVARDGLLTSTTPEEASARWQWLRFSAAASPGNSGGPLVDTDGAVLGVVVRKSANENLNVALPVQVVLDAPPNVAQLGGFFGYQLPVLDAIEGERINIDVTLPLPLAGFYDALTQQATALSERTLAQLLAKNAAQIFPRGQGADLLLNSVNAAQHLALILRKPDGTWASFAPDMSAPATLPANGRVVVGGLAGHLVVKIRRPDDVPAAQFYGDSKAYIDSVLKAIPLYRAVGEEKVRITSLGPASSASLFDDAYGRRWQVRTWNQAQLDQVLVSFALATPDGYVALLRPCPSSGATDALRDLRAMTSFAQVSFGGTLAQWRDYLAQKSLLAKAFATLDIRFDYGKTFKYRSARASLDYTQDVLRIAQDSVLNLNFAYFCERAQDRRLPDSCTQVVWDVVGIGVRAQTSGGPSLWFTRHQRPPSTLPAEVHTAWMKRVLRSYPFNATLVEDAGNVQVAAIAGAGRALDSDVLYQLTYRDEGKPAAALVSAAMVRWFRAVSVLEE